MAKRSTVAKSRSGPTITQEERAARGYRTRTFSMPDTTWELIERLAEHHGSTKSAIIVMAVGAIAGDLRR